MPSPIIVCLPLAKVTIVPKKSPMKKKIIPIPSATVVPIMRSAMKNRSGIAILIHASGTVPMAAMIAPTIIPAKSFLLML